MTGIDLATAQAKLTLWLAAEDKLANSQSYQVGDRTVTRADLKEIRETIDYWEGKVRRLSRSSRGGMKTKRVVVVE
ncbi:MAG: hypothetical protein KAS32_01545 [Candidatus Peribacteraceae bacterium]|nr:hypothetical protein [Candidatus Peribacteraceae bacterium]